MAPGKQSSDFLSKWYCILNKNLKSYPILKCTLHTQTLHSLSYIPIIFVRISEYLQKNLIERKVCHLFSIPPTEDFKFNPTDSKLVAG